MSRPNWKLPLVCALILWVAGSDLSYSQINSSPIQHKSKADQTQTERPETPVVIEGKQQGADKKQERCDNPEADNGPDLCAQWAAANAARKSAELAQSSLYWTTASFVALVLTLFATAWAARAAARASQAAELSIKHQQTSTEHQLRAYIRVTPLSFDKVRSLAPFELSNDGQTPASSISTRINWHWFEPPQLLPDNFDFPDKPATNKTSSPTISPGQKVVITFPTHPKEIAEFKQGIKSMFFYGRVEYDDVFGKHRVTKFAYQLENDAHSEKGNLLMLNRYNEMI